ncbi:YpbS family protein [Marinicrinis sediminis]|uniref:YpbS family protein n=1 Tax=Marinicrinis sediminis TaxID=1652465 RepID=A0ABW5R5F5_9BACL
MNAHEAISAHSKKQFEHLQQFYKLDQQREMAIEEALSLCKAGQPYTVDEINLITKKINEHAKEGISPVRVYVTPEMVQTYATK